MEVSALLQRNQHLPNKLAEPLAEVKRAQAKEVIYQVLQRLPGQLFQLVSPDRYADAAYGFVTFALQSLSQLHIVRQYRPYLQIISQGNDRGVGSMQLEGSQLSKQFCHPFLSNGFDLESQPGPALSFHHKINAIAPQFFVHQVRDKHPIEDGENRKSPNLCQMQDGARVGNGFTHLLIPIGCPYEWHPSGTPNPLQSPSPVS